MSARIRITAVLVLSLVFTLAAFAQTTTSVLEGKVTDPSGAALPGVGVEVSNGVMTRSVVTDADGFYRAVALPAGTYNVTFSKGDFQKKVLRDVSVVLDHTVKLDSAMSISPRADTVTVAATAAVIDPTTSSTRQVIESRTIDSIPLNGRNYLDLIGLLPGVASNAVAAN